MLKKLIAAILLLSLFSCEERIYPEMEEKNENLLVIEGMINSNPGPYTIRISSTSNLILYYLRVSREQAKNSDA